MSNDEDKSDGSRTETVTQVGRLSFKTKLDIRYEPSGTGYLATLTAHKHPDKKYVIANIQDKRSIRYIKGESSGNAKEIHSALESKVVEVIREVRSERPSYQSEAYVTNVKELDKMLVPQKKPKKNSSEK